MDDSGMGGWITSDAPPGNLHHHSHRLKVQEDSLKTQQQKLEVASRRKYIRAMFSFIFFLKSAELHPSGLIEMLNAFPFPKNNLASCDRPWVDCKGSVKVYAAATCGFSRLFHLCWVFFCLSEWFVQWLGTFSKLICRDLNQRYHWDLIYVWDLS